MPRSSSTRAALVSLCVIGVICLVAFTEAKAWDNREAAERHAEQRSTERAALREKASDCQTCVDNGGRWGADKCMTEEGVVTCDAQALKESKNYDGKFKLEPREPRVAIEDDEEEESSTPPPPPAQEGGDYEFECDVTGAKFNEADGRYHHGDEEDGLDVTVAAYASWDSLESKYPTQFGLLPAAAKAKSAWAYRGPAGKEAGSAPAASGEFEFECDVTGAQFNEADGGYHFGDPEDGLDITQAAFAQFDSLSSSHAAAFGKLPAGAKSKSAWTYFGPANKKQTPAAAPAAAAPASGEFEFECDMTGAQFNEADGAYHFGDPDDGLDITQAAYAAFNSLSGQYAAAWNKLPAGAKSRDAWKYFGPVNKKISHEFECDATGDMFNEADGGYHFGDPEDGLDITQAAYAKFGSLKNQHSKEWSALPAAAKTQGAWKYFGPAGKRQAAAAAAPASGGKNCNPAAGACTCGKCCKKYLKDAESCNECLESECPPSTPPPPPPQCNPQAGACTCKKCCKKYLKDPEACLECIKDENCI